MCVCANVHAQDRVTHEGHCSDSVLIFCRDIKMSQDYRSSARGYASKTEHIVLVHDLAENNVRCSVDRSIY